MFCRSILVLIVWPVSERPSVCSYIYLFWWRGIVAFLVPIMLSCIVGIKQLALNPSANSCFPQKLFSQDPVPCIMCSSTIMTPVWTKMWQLLYSGLSRCKMHHSVNTPHRTVGWLPLQMNVHLKGKSFVINFVNWILRLKMQTPSVSVSLCLYEGF